LIIAFNFVSRFACERVFRLYLENIQVTVNGFTFTFGFSPFVVQKKVEKINRVSKLTLYKQQKTAAQTSKDNKRQEEETVEFQLEFFSVLSTGLVKCHHGICKYSKQHQRSYYYPHQKKKKRKPCQCLG